MWRHLFIVFLSGAAFAVGTEAGRWAATKLREAAERQTAKARAPTPRRRFRN